jgi:hypothetical protein
LFKYGGNKPKTILPAEYQPYPEHNKREKQRKDLRAEIEHVQKNDKLRGEALEEVTQ